MGYTLLSGNETELLDLYSGTTFFLERLMIGLKKKQKSGDWDRSFGVKEAGVFYVGEDADQPFELPEEIVKEL